MATNDYGENMVNVCTSCNRDIAQGEIVVRFPCPKCGAVDILRCAKCRRLSNPYRCPNCGFTGP